MRRERGDVASQLVVEKRLCFSALEPNQPETIELAIHALRHQELAGAAIARIVIQFTGSGKGRLGPRYLIGKSGCYTGNLKPNKLIDLRFFTFRL
jgi:hypothetical protein